MPVKRLLTPRTLLGATALGLTAAALAWGIGLGAAATHVAAPVTATSARDSVLDTQYTRPRAEAAVAATGVRRVSRLWSFNGRLPPGWQLSSDAGVVARITRGVALTTGLTSSVESMSPPVRLQRGTYRVLVDGAVASGGLQLGVQTADGLACNSASYFDSKSTSRARSTLPLQFSADGRRPLRIVLGNWVERNRSSVWDLESVRIAPVGTSRGRRSLSAQYAALASPLVQKNAIPIVNLFFDWKFGPRVPEDWQVVPGVRTRRARSALFVRTTSTRYGSAFATRLELGPGPYLLQVDGRIVRGGLMVGAIDARTNTWLRQHFYWSGQSGAPGVMATPFRVRRNGTVILVVGNWAVRPASSTWLLRHVELDQLF